MSDKTPHPADTTRLKAVASPEKSEQVVRLLVRHQDDLFRYIFSLLPHEEDARDALQETCVALYRKAGGYDEAKPFLAWAFGFAYLEVMKQRERSQRACRHLQAELVEILAREREQQEPELAARLEALETCLARLSPDDQELIRQRYARGCQIDELAERLNTSRRTLFRQLDRIRRLLLECISRSLQTT
jgi:RNA polymerase sigma-70 factor (ECF subfamily)